MRLAKRKTKPNFQTQDFSCEQNVLRVIFFFPFVFCKTFTSSRRVSKVNFYMQTRFEERLFDTFQIACFL